MLSIRGCLLDKDGTLLDFQETWGAWTGRVITQICAGNMYNVARVDAALGYDRGRNLIDATSVIVAGSARDICEAIAGIVGAERIDEIEEQIALASACVDAVPMRGLDEALGSLAALGCTLGVATNDTEDAARAQLSRLGIVGSFAYVAGYDSGFGAKPGPGMCSAFLETVRLAPYQVAMVGDSVHDMRAGRMAGMHCVAVASGTASADDLRPFADVVLADITALPGYISQQRT